MDLLELQKIYMSMPYDLSGSRSKNRFRVELLWGVDKMLDLLQTNQAFTMIFDYVCDIEIHLNDSFEFYQIKSHLKSQPAYTTNSLTKIKTNTSQGSILGKLYILNKDQQLNCKLAVVSNSPYIIKDNNRDYSFYTGEHCFSELPVSEQKKIQEALKSELKIKDIDVSQIFYICTNMNLEDPENEVQGKLVVAFDKIEGCEIDRPHALYSLIYDQVSEKACYEFAANNYSELIEKKGITRTEMKYMLDCHAKNEKTGIDQTKAYIDGLDNILAQKKYKKALAKLVTCMPKSKVLQQIEKNISNFLKKDGEKIGQDGSMETFIEALIERFHESFPMEYNNAEKTVFYMIILFKFREGAYDEDDI